MAHGHLAEDPAHFQCDTSETDIRKLSNWLGLKIRDKEFLQSRWCQSIALQISQKLQDYQN